jgi:hypothetical protein
VKREELLEHLAGGESNTPLELDCLPEAAAAAMAIPVLSGRSNDVADARAAAAQVALPQGARAIRSQLA